MHRGRSAIDGGSEVRAASRSSFLGHPTRSCVAQWPMDPAGPLQNAQNAFRTGPWTALENAPPTGSTGPHRES
jgi:hypothetical protein